MKSAEAGGDGWLGVFFATLTWSLGCAGATYAGVTKVKPPDLYGWIAGSLVGALAIALLLGVGVLNVWPAFTQLTGPLPIRVIMAFVVTAWLTYGPVGFFLSAFIGIWLGRHVAKRQSR